MGEPQLGLSGVRGPGRDVRHHPVKTSNCKYREGGQQGQDLSPWPKQWGGEQWTRDMRCSLSHYR